MAGAWSAPAPPDRTTLMRVKGSIKPNGDLNPVPDEVEIWVDPTSYLMITDEGLWRVWTDGWLRLDTIPNG